LPGDCSWRKKDTTTTQVPKRSDRKVGFRNAGLWARKLGRLRRKSFSASPNTKTPQMKSTVQMEVGVKREWGG